MDRMSELHHETLEGHEKNRSLQFLHSILIFTVVPQAHESAGCRVKIPAFPTLCFLILKTRLRTFSRCLAVPLPNRPPAVP